MKHKKKPLSSLLKVLDQRFSSPELEQKYLQSLQPAFMIPTMANAVFACALLSYKLFGLGLMKNADEDDIKNDRWLETRRGTPEGNPEGEREGKFGKYLGNELDKRLDGEHEFWHFVWIMVSFFFYMVVIALLIIKQFTKLLKSIQLETLYVIWGCFLTEMFCWGSKYSQAKIHGEVSVENESDITSLIALYLSSITAVVCLLVPVRFHLGCLVAFVNIVSFFIQLCICGTPMLRSLPLVLMMYCFLMFIAISGSYSHEKYHREKWLAEKKVRTLEKLAKGKDVDAYVAEEKEHHSSLEIDVLRQLPKRLRICILGGTKFMEASSELVVGALAGKVSERLNNMVVVLTGGMPGVQQAFAQSLGSSFDAQVHLLPEGKSSDFGVGKDITAGHNLPERMQVFGSLGHVYVCIEGGPGVAKEAKQAFERGAVVLPIMSTGGASSGMFDFPQGALEKPDFITDYQWSMMKAQGDPSATASAITDVLLGIVGKHKESHTLST